ncbi:type I DNA topoisomerase [Candidatus Parcubacteria bacterium]|nr:MAG: type I DNA topoisomerase [Candidatus Parcubacteria bacterium]
MKDLILVESPTKARTLYKFLGNKYAIEASLGHIRDLPKGDFGVDIEHGFAPKYVIPQDKRKIIELLKEKVKDAHRVIIATDPDREGEAIAYHLYEILKDEVSKKTLFERIVFHEITQKAILEAISHPRQINTNLVAAQTARRVLDRIVGYKLSPILWKKIKRKLSAGRVQSVALRLIVEREKEVEKFKEKDYCKLFAKLSSKKTPEPIEFELVKINDQNIARQEKISLYDGEYRYSLTILDKKRAEEIEKDIKNNSFVIKFIIQKETKRSPHPPFTTSTLQQEAFRRLGFSGKRTMSVAQKLYEEGIITYHRTDSFNLSTDFVKEARDYIDKEFGREYLSEKPKIFQTKSKLAQEAHEAIRPTNPTMQQQEVARISGKDYANLYSLIYKRALSTQMSDAVYFSTKIEAETKGKDLYLFEVNGRVLKFPGFLKLWFYEEEEQILPELSEKDELSLNESRIVENKTNPPARYNEASIIASLEKHGIGRPSTYAPIISTITGRDYIEKQERKFVPTKIGTIVNDFLVANFSDIDDIPFTASMEDELDNVANGKRDWVEILKEFYKPFEQKLEKAEEQKKIVIELEKTGKICPECGGDIVVRRGKFGKFYACNNFPNCKYKESYVEETGLTCPKDQGRVIIKKTRKGRIFYGCSNYPNCNFAAWNKNDLSAEKNTNN